MAATLACFVFVVNIFACSLATDTTLLSVVQIHRHGERTPSSYYPNDPYKDISNWGVSEGQLTNFGKRQHFELGQLTRRRYGEIIPRRYTRETFLAQSTNMDRTFMSAAANLAGLFPPVGDQIWNPNLGKSWQPIPVFLANPAIVNPTNVCRRQSAAWIDTLSNNEYYVNLNAKYQPLYDYLTRYTGTTVNSIASAYGIWDTLLIESRQNFTLPRWTRAVYPDPLLEVAIAFFRSFSFTEELKVLSTYTMRPQYCTNSINIQEGTAPHHYNREVRNFSDVVFSTKDWEMMRYRMTSLDYFLWDYLKTKVYVNRPEDLNSLKERISREISNIL